MTFEYRDSSGARLTVATTSIGISLWTQPEDVAIAHDRVEEVIAGIRDAARTASGQQPETPPWIADGRHGPTPEELRQQIARAIHRYDNHHALANNDVPSAHHYGEADAVLAVLADPAVGQPAEAQAAGEALLTAAERQFLKFALDLAFDRMVSDDGFTDEDEAALARLRRIAFGTEQLAEARPADLLAACATEYQVPVPEGGGTTLQVRRQSPLHGMGWAVSTRAYGGGRAWTTEGWQESISALSVDRLFCWPDATTAVNEARRALATVEEDETR